MIQFRLRVTWPLAILIVLALAAWLVRRSSQAQAHPATRPISRATIIDMPDPDSQQAGESTFDRLEREAAEAGRRAYEQPTEFTGAADRLRSKRYARQNKT